jgi:hypothetical protein
MMESPSARLHAPAVRAYLRVQQVREIPMNAPVGVGGRGLARPALSRHQDAGLAPRCRSVEFTGQRRDSGGKYWGER